MYCKFFSKLLKLPGANVFCECYANDYKKLNEIKKISGCP